MCSPSVCVHLQIYNGLSSLKIFNISPSHHSFLLQALPFALHTHNLIENLTGPIMVGWRGLTAPFPATMRKNLLENDQLFHFEISVSIIESLKHCWLLAGEEIQAFRGMKYSTCVRDITGILMEHREGLAPLTMSVLSPICDSSQLWVCRNANLSPCSVIGCWICMKSRLTSQCRFLLPGLHAATSSSEWWEPAETQIYVCSGLCASEVSLGRQCAYLELLMTVARDIWLTFMLECNRMLTQSCFRPDVIRDSYDDRASVWSNKMPKFNLAAQECCHIKKSNTQTQKHTASLILVWIGLIFFSEFNN